MSAIFRLAGVRLFALALLRCVFVVASQAATQDEGPVIRYEISLAHPEQHTFHIKMKVPNVSGSLTVQMPA